MSLGAAADVGRAGAGRRRRELPAHWDNDTDRPIKHVIVIIGENRSFDHVFATYQPQPGQTVHNLLSEGIIKLDGDKNAIAGPNFAKAQQLAATDTGAERQLPAQPTRSTNLRTTSCRPRWPAVPRALRATSPTDCTAAPIRPPVPSIAS